MKTLGKVVGLLSILTLLASPVFAVEGATAGETKPLSFVQFADLKENRGTHIKMLQRRYEEYRKGRWIPQSTLEVERLR